MPLAASPDAPTTSPLTRKRAGGRGERRGGRENTITATLDHRSFSVERPASASITEMIQNRITICGSVQPFCSK